MDRANIAAILGLPDPVGIMTADPATLGGYTVVEFDGRLYKYLESYQPYRPTLRLPESASPILAKLARFRWDRAIGIYGTGVLPDLAACATVQTFANSLADTWRGRRVERKRAWAVFDWALRFELRAYLDTLSMKRESEALFALGELRGERDLAGGRLWRIVAAVNRANDAEGTRVCERFNKAHKVRTIADGSPPGVNARGGHEASVVLNYATRPWSEEKKDEGPSLLPFWANSVAIDVALSTLWDDAAWLIGDRHPERCADLAATIDASWYALVERLIEAR